jgi:polysaccharide pyruvyl transferase WcaK-like protein
MTSAREHGRPEPCRGPIALFGLFGVGNFGNEASLRSAIDAARELAPERELVCVCAAPDRVSAMHGVRAVPIQMSSWEDRYHGARRVARLMMRPFVEWRRTVAARRFLEGCSAVVVPGTGILDDFGVRPWEMPWGLYRWSRQAARARVPFAFVAVGAGPIEDSMNRRLMVAATRQATSRSFRDEGSHAFMATLGAASARDPVVPDVVFGLTHPAPTPVRTAAPLRVGLGVMAYYGWRNDPASGSATFDRYLARLAALARGLLDDGHELRLLIGEHTDEVAVARLAAVLGPDVAPRITFEPVGSIEGLLDQIDQVDAVVATRFHNVVGALMMERPVVSIGYAAKNQEVLERYGLGAHHHPADDFDPDAVRRDLRELVGRWDVLQPTVAAQRAADRAEVWERYRAALVAASPLERSELA